MNASHRHGTFHLKTANLLLTLRDDIDEWSADEDFFHPEDDKSMLRPDITGWRGGDRTIVIEISLTTPNKDYGWAKQFYESCGVPEYIVVDLKKEVVNRFKLVGSAYKDDANSFSKELENKLFNKREKL